MLNARCSVIALLFGIWHFYIFVFQWQTNRVVAIYQLCRRRDSSKVSQNFAHDCLLVPIVVSRMFTLFPSRWFEVFEVFCTVP